TQRVELFLAGEKPYPLVIAGGVAANSRLRKEFASLADRYGVPLFIPPPRLCTDNAAMVAALGYDLSREGACLEGEALLSLNATSSLSFT
ncbi:MAG TPA: hypothetical protein ENL15_00080, partial [Firmicutes bacterium]|nr:hypothetical protein [Bacillota bacterium]